MQRLQELQNSVESIRAGTSQDIPGLAINVLLSVGMSGGLSKADLVSQLDATIGDLNHCVGILTTGQSAGLNCAGLLYADPKGSFYLTDKGNALVGAWGTRLSALENRK